MARKRRPTSAAFFDLDRTLLRGASGAVFSAAMKRAGVLSHRANPLEPVLFGVFNLLGENWPTMMATKAAARASKGWKRSDVQAAAADAAPTLASALLPYAAAELQMHRDAGRLLVLATTTPYDLVKPFADLLGFDEIIATRYDFEGETYTGRIDGEYVWGKGKARSVRAFAEEHDLELADSHAYSDSYYDVPLLSIVGHPHVINPDPRMVAIATLRRWPQKWFDVPEGVPKFAGIEPQKVVMMLTRPELFPYARFRMYGTKRIPRTGAAILVANHRSYFDPVAIGLLLGRVGRPVRFLGKKEVFDAPIVGDFARSMGGIRVDRGTGSDAPLQAAEAALRAGDMVAVMPEGTIPRGPAFFDPELQGRWGAMRLAHATGAPVIPIGIWGTERVWPRSSKIPLIGNVLSPPTVTMRVGQPIEITGTDVEADTETMMAAISALLPAEARRVRNPSQAEMAATYPSGVIPIEGDDEAQRRPGSD